jgi:hypothetical protein
MIKYIALIVLVFCNLPSRADEIFACPTQRVEGIDYWASSRDDLGLAISVDIKAYRKWVRNALEAKLSPEKIIISQFKKTFPATIFIRSDRGQKCQLKATVRISGDFKDHIRMMPGGKLVTSMDVKLKNGNIRGVVAFKLFLPETRKGANEVHATRLLKQLGILSPRTALTSVSTDGVNYYPMIFQEKFRKELLEASGRRESVMFAGDETLLMDPKYLNDGSVHSLSFSRVINKKFTTRTLPTKNLSLRAYEDMQTLYREARIRALARPDSPRQLLLSNQSVKIHTLDHYALIMLSMRAIHGLYPNNMRFYYDPMYNRFEPMYYDGEADPSAPLSDEALELRHDQDYIAGILKSKATVEPLLAKLRDILRVSNGDYKLFVSKTTENLTSLRDRYTPLAQQDPKVAQADERLITIARNHGVRILSNRKALAQEVSKDEAQVGISDLYSLEQARTLYVPRSSPHEDGYKLIDYGPMKVLTNSPESILIRKLPKGITEIEMRPKSDDSRYVLVGLISNAKIVYDGTWSGKPLQENPLLGRTNARLITGCVTVLDATLIDHVDINIKNAHCEDGINFIRSRGNIRSIAIMNTAFDALDADFSDIVIDRLKVRSAGNDCFDVSYGHYKIKNGVLENCGDKGVSSGENSIVDILNVVIRNSDVGIASKDWSLVTIEKYDISGVSEAFRKNRESRVFDGSLR